LASTCIWEILKNKSLKGGGGNRAKESISKTTHEYYKEDIRLEKVVPQLRGTSANVVTILERRNPSTHMQATKRGETGIWKKNLCRTGVTWGPIRLATGGDRGELVVAEQKKVAWS